MHNKVVNYIKNAKKSFFIIEKIKKYRKCPALKFILVPHLAENVPAVGPLQGEHPHGPALIPQLHVEAAVLKRWMKRWMNLWWNDGWNGEWNGDQWWWNDGWNGEWNGDEWWWNGDEMVNETEWNGKWKSAVMIWLMKLLMKQWWYGDEMEMKWWWNDGWTGEDMVMKWWWYGDDMENEMVMKWWMNWWGYG